MIQSGFKVKYMLNAKNSSKGVQIASVTCIFIHMNVWFGLGLPSHASSPSHPNRVTELVAQLPRVPMHSGLATAQGR